MVTLLFDQLERLLAGFFFGEVADVQQFLLLFLLGLVERLALLDQEAVEFLLLTRQGVFAGLDLAVEIIEVFFLGGQRVELAIEVVLTLGQSALLVGQLPAGLVHLGVEGLAALGQIVAGVEFDLLGEGFALGLGLVDQGIGLGAGLTEGLRTHELQCDAHRESTDDQSDDADQQDLGGGGGE